MNHSFCFILPVILCLWPGSAAADIVLKADANSGRDDCWIKRYDAGKNTWGIRGTGDPLSGSIWFNAFPGKTADYHVTLGIVAEKDGQPQYSVTAGNRVLKKGKYPCPGSSCDCSKNTSSGTIEIGTHRINKGEKIEVWGKSVYPCGDHGAYTRWYELRFVPVGEPGDSTEMIFPDNGARLEEGREYTLQGEGTDLSWSYDANSDGLGTVPIGTGKEVAFTIPTGITGPRQITITVSGAGGNITRTLSIVEPAPRIELLSPEGGEEFAAGDTVLVEWTADTQIITDVSIYLSADDGRTWRLLTIEGSISTLDSQWGGFTWVIPQSMASSPACRIRIEKYDTSDPLMKDETDSSFTILGSDGVAVWGWTGHEYLPAVSRAYKKIPSIRATRIMQQGGLNPVDLRGRSIVSRRATGIVVMAVDPRHDGDMMRKAGQNSGMRNNRNRDWNRD